MTLGRSSVTVKLSSNGGYWQADYTDANGKRRKKGLGPKTEVSRRQALKLCQSLSNELTNHPERREAGRVPTLSEFLERYAKSRTDIGEGSLYLYDLTGRYLKKFFGPEVRIDRITRAASRDWRTALKAGALTEGRPVSETTACNHCKYAKSMFGQAVEDGMLPLNPFAKLKSSAPDPAREWHYVGVADLEKLLSACPGPGWKCLIALCRLAGLRRGEAIDLAWTSVDWRHRRLTVYATKTAKTSPTGGVRVVPIEPRLYEILIDALEQAVPGQHSVCGLSANNLRRDFAAIRKRAGLPEWAEPFQVMRRNRETDWAKRFPQHAVSEWLGHDIAVSAKFYLNVTEDLYQRVASGCENV